MMTLFFEDRFKLGFNFLLQHHHGEVNIIHTFWEDVTKMLTKEMNNASESKPSFLILFKILFKKKLLFYLD